MIFFISVCARVNTMAAVVVSPIIAGVERTLVYLRVTHVERIGDRIQREIPMKTDALMI